MHKISLRCIALVGRKKATKRTQEPTLQSLWWYWGIKYGFWQCKMLLCLKDSNIIKNFLSFFFYFTILYWFCHVSTCIRHGCTRVPHPETPSHLPPRTIPLGHPSAPAPSLLYPALNLDWRFISYMILYMFECHSPKSSHPLPLPQSPKDCYSYF